MILQELYSLISSSLFEENETRFRKIEKIHPIIQVEREVKREVEREVKREVEREVERQVKRQVDRMWFPDLELGLGPEVKVKVEPINSRYNNNATEYNATEYEAEVRLTIYESIVDVPLHLNPYRIRVL